MPGKNVLFVLLDKFADWEAAPLASAINQTAGWRVQTVAPRKTLLRSMGGFSVMPDLDVNEALGNDFAGLALIGGLSWRTDEAKTIEPLVRRALERNTVVGAVCDATAFLAKLGVLNGISHTGNQLDDLKGFAGVNYTGGALYENRAAVRGGNVVTANGTVAMDFAREMLATLGVMTDDDAGKWYRLFKFGFCEAMAEGMWWVARQQ